MQVQRTYIYANGHSTTSWLLGAVKFVMAIRFTFSRRVRCETRKKSCQVKCNTRELKCILHSVRALSLPSTVTIHSTIVEQCTKCFYIKILKTKQSRRAPQQRRKCYKMQSMVVLCSFNWKLYTQAFDCALCNQTC